VIIHGKTDVVGVMGSKPIHLMSPEERNQPAKIKDYFIDTGLKKSEVLELIEIGDPITRERELIKMGPCINAKSLDNRISVFVLLEAFKKMKHEKFDCTIFAVFTVQEELGLRGARTVAHKISPDFAINIDTTIAFDVPGAQTHEFVSRLGEGVAIKIMDQSVMCDYRMVKFIKKIAMDQQIKWQNELLPAGGTDTSAIQMAGDGCICGAISIPTRHIHQVIEMVHESDVNAARLLISALAKNIIKFEWSHT
jgi:endoglucanase